MKTKNWQEPKLTAYIKSDYSYHITKAQPKTPKYERTYQGYINWLQSEGYTFEIKDGDWDVWRTPQGEKKYRTREIKQVTECEVKK